MFSHVSQTIAIGLQLILLVNAHANPGRCRQNDELFNSEEGGCLDFRSGLVWSRALPRAVKFKEAESYCASLATDKSAGFADWTLPSAKQLISLAEDRGPLEHFSFPVLEFFWSSSSDPNGSWAISLSDGNDTAFLSKKESANALCYRKPSDRDHDGVPDSSDNCSRTPKDQHRVETTGKRKGCGDDDQPYIVPKAGACNQLPERSCRSTKGCGWSPTTRQCIDITSETCSTYPDKWWCATAAGCNWENNKCVTL